MMTDLQIKVLGWWWGTTVLLSGKIIFRNHRLIVWSRKGTGRQKKRFWYCTSRTFQKSARTYSRVTWSALPSPVELVHAHTPNRTIQYDEIIIILILLNRRNLIFLITPKEPQLIIFLLPCMDAVMKTTLVQVSYTCLQLCENLRTYICYFFTHYKTILC